MVYWGYHREETPVVMKEWLNSTSPNTVYMLTDRAMVELETDNQGHVVVDDNTIESIESWVISNGNSRGYIAPFNQSDLEDPFSSYYNAATGKPENVFTDYTAAGRYTAQESKLEPATSPLFCTRLYPSQPRISVRAVISFLPSTNALAASSSGSS